MANNEDWEDIKSRGELEAQPNKWKPLIIEYGYKNLNGLLFFCWRVQGTQHTFVIKFNQLNDLSKGDVPKHIEDFLETFREDWLKWVAGGLKEPWMREYYEQYKHYIEI